jgi:hypothetical protein
MINIKCCRDNAHGWLQVPLEIIDSLGLVDQISAFSQIKDDTVYLDEKTDGKEFLSKLGEQNVKITSSRYHGVSRIRYYQMYSPISAKYMLSVMKEI